VSVTASQRRLADITEMIHSASLLHDDVIDEASLRRGAPSANAVFGNKLAILGGDYLLARSSAALARLRHVGCVELLSTVIEHLVKGEVLQMKTIVQAAQSDGGVPAAFDLYLRKTYYKTGSLIANSCRAAALVEHHSPALQEAAFAYGKHIGLAFQLVDDALDFDGSLHSLGKPALQDMALGLSTAPVLFAAQQRPDILPAMARRFQGPTDVDLVLAAVRDARAVDATRALATLHAQRAVQALAPLPHSRAKAALAALAARVVHRAR
jgi:geranylgeranyl pyrophosphate synthase